MTKASVAAGADGLIIEMHTDPDNSMTGDGVQSLFPDQFANLLVDLEKLAPLLGKKFDTQKEAILGRNSNSSIEDWFPHE